MKRSLLLIVLLVIVVGTGINAQSKTGPEYKRHFDGPLKKSSANPRYFIDNRGKSILFTGSHTWANFQDYGRKDEKPFDYATYLNFMQEHNHNFMKLWTWEQFQQAPWTEDQIFFSPMPWLRSGAGKANDGGSQFDLDKWNEEYFARLRKRIIEAGNKGIYISVMLFQGFSLNKGSTKVGDPWPYHPLNPKNNIQEIGPKDPSVDADNKATLHSMENPEVLKYQEKYVLKVLSTLNDLDNVLYEIINEGGTTDWSYHMIDFIHATEKRMSNQHMVGMTDRIEPEQPGEILINSNADWIALGNEPHDWLYPGSTYLVNYRDNPPANTTGKVIIADTDHIWGHGGNYKWAWKCLVRGLNPIFMDPYRSLSYELKNAPWMYVGGIAKDSPDYPDWELLRLNMGYVLTMSHRVELTKMAPHNELSSTTYCLANPGHEYLIYFPEGGMATLDMRASVNNFEIEWYIPLLNKSFKAPEPLVGGAYNTITPPFTGDAVLYLKSTN